MSDVSQVLLYPQPRPSPDIVRMRYRSDRELSLLVAEGIHYQEDQHGDIVLATIESVPYRVDKAVGRPEHLETDICGMTLRSVINDIESAEQRSLPKAVD